MGSPILYRKSENSPMPYDKSHRSPGKMSEEDMIIPGSIVSQNKKQLDLKVDYIIIEEEKVSERDDKSGISLNSCSELEVDDISPQRSGRYPVINSRCVVF